MNPEPNNSEGDVPPPRSPNHLPVQCWKCSAIHLWKHRVWTKQKCGEGSNIHICPECAHDAHKLIDARTGRAVVNRDMWLDQPPPDPAKFPPPLPNKLRRTVKNTAGAAAELPAAQTTTTPTTPTETCACPPSACRCWMTDL